MNTIVGAILGLLGGGGLGWFLIKQFTAKANQTKIDDANKTADLTVQEAKITAKRTIGEAENKAENLLEDSLAE